LPNALDPNVAAAVDAGDIGVITLVRIDLPGKTVGYHTGGRPFTYGAIEYLPNRFLPPEGISSGTGNQISEAQLLFSNVPTTNPDDAIADIEQYDYINAPVTVTYLCGDPHTDEVLGALDNRFYELADLDYSADAADEKGNRALTIKAVIQTLARRLRDKTYAVRSLAAQQFHNNPADTSLRYVAISPEWPEEWGQR